MSDEKFETTGVSLCKTQHETTVLVEEEQKQLAKRLSRKKVVPVLHLTVFAYNCDRHEKKDVCHMDFVAGSGRLDIPGSLKISIEAVEKLLETLKARLQ